MTKPSDNMPMTSHDLEKNNSDNILENNGASLAGYIDYDPTSLNTVRANWYFGKWEDLAAIQIEDYKEHPDKGKFALLKAAGHQQLCQYDEAKKCIRLARQWQCDDRLISQILVAGVHNTLAKTYALQNNDEKTKLHFEAAISIGENNNDRRLANQARTVQELSKLGLLPQAAKILGESLESLQNFKERPSRQQAKIGILNTEVELINHELSLAHKKNQLYLGRKIETQEHCNGVDLERIEQLSPSQLGQDIWVLEKTNFKRGGFFVEFGATDGVLLSNSYLLEKEFAWKGICAEPNPVFFSKLKKNRNCIVSDACISHKTGDTVEFILANEYGGIADIAKAGKHGDKVAAYEKEGKSLFLKTISLSDFLIENKAPKTIDYLSIDTEGSEFSILSSFPFENWHIRCLSIEHNYEPQRELIYELLTSKGFERTSRQWDDLYFSNMEI